VFSAWVRITSGRNKDKNCVLTRPMAGAVLLFQAVGGHWLGRWLKVRSFLNFRYI
jgi:hypothetical protein